MASATTRWFVVASPTGSTESEFFSTVGVADVAQTGSSYVNLGAVGNDQITWGIVGTYPTSSTFSPGVYIRDLANFNYTTSFYTYTDVNTSTSAFSVQQDLQKIHFPGILTGSYNGRFVTSASVSTVGSNGQIALFDGGILSPLFYTALYSMSFFTTDIAGVSQNTMLNNVVAGDRIILRNVTENEEATYTVVTKDTGLGIGIVAFSVSYSSGNTGTPNLQSLFDVDFIKTGSNQQTFYIVGTANPRGNQQFANQFTVGSVGGSGDYRSGIIKVYATESNNTSDWNRLLRTVTADNGATYDPNASGPSYVALNHNLFMFTASAGNSGSWELLVDLA
jgi:hypothetical protein